MSADSVVLEEALWAVVSTKEKLNYHFHWKGKIQTFCFDKRKFSTYKGTGRERKNGNLYSLNSTSSLSFFSFLDND